MEHVDLGRRIAEARASRRWNQAQLAQQLGMDRTTLVKIEQGQRRVTALELLDLARELGRRVDWFLTPPPAAIAQHRGAQPEDYSTLPIDEELETLALDTTFLIDSGLLTPPARRHVFARPASRREAERLGAELREAAGLGDDPVRDVAQVAHSLGTLCFARELGEGDADAASMSVGETGIALINSSRAVGRRRLSAAQELVHVMVGDTYRTDLSVDRIDSEDQHEARIDRAARAFLLPERLRAQWEETARSDGVRIAAVKLGSEYRVDMATLARRLQDLGAVDAPTAATIRGVRTTKSDIVGLGLVVPHDFEGTALPLAYAQAVIRGYAGEFITMDRALDLMRGTFTEEDFTPRSDLAPETLWSVLG